MACVISVSSGGACGRLAFEDRSGDQIDGGGDSVDAKVDSSLNIPDAVNAAVGCTAAEQGGSFSNDFNAGEPAGYLTVISPGTIAEFVNGELRLVPTSNNGVNYARTGSTISADFRNRRLATEVTMIANTAQRIDVPFQIGDRRTSNNDTYLEIAQVQGLLNATSWLSNVETPLFSRAFNPLADRWWQFRENAGTVFMETSIDGDNWLAFTSTPTPVWWNQSGHGFATGTIGRINAPLGETHFDTSVTVNFGSAGFFGPAITRRITACLPNRRAHARCQVRKQRQMQQCKPHLSERRLIREPATL
jgi:hypothetical protein